MKRFAIAALIAASAFPVLRAQQAVPEIPFDSVPNVLKLPPDLNFGEDAGVALNSKGHVFVYTRSNSATGSAYGGAASQLLEFDQNGKFVREIGKGLYAWAFAHVVRVDKDDNIWAVDKGSDMVIRFNPEGHVTMVFGRKKEASDKEAEPWERNRNPPLPPVNGQFRQPTDVAWNANGEMFISDGYVNARVAKYDKNGDWVKSFGEPGSGPGQLNTPHSIAIDAKGNVYVANRGNVRIEVYDSDGKYLRQIKLDVPVPADAKPAIGNPLAPNAAPGTMSPGAPWAVCITPGPNQVLYAADAFPGRIYKVSLDGKMLGVLGKAGKQPKQFGWIHEIACPSENELWVAEVLNWRVQKLVLHPGTSGATR
ncbi:MAG TPA: peptidyl-alpha-hydroxyglycine alpha-amidating lyase family protein [Vicinamibacterales bacterium]|nr:peptidyl-alpha-hydroxyglycine alpha-amidating lyase family protein [Vicinamibacterales bacterium]